MELQKFATCQEKKKPLKYQILLGDVPAELLTGKCSPSPAFDTHDSIAHCYHHLDEGENECIVQFRVTTFYSKCILLQMYIWMFSIPITHRGLEDLSSNVRNKNSTALEVEPIPHGVLSFAQGGKEVCKRAASHGLHLKCGHGQYIRLAMSGLLR